MLWLMSSDFIDASHDFWTCSIGFKFRDTFRVSNQNEEWTHYFARYFGALTFCVFFTSYCNYFKE